jgi:hypothetical protein
MKLKRGQQKLIIILFTTAVILLIADIVISKFYKQAKSNSDNHIEVSAADLDKIFHSTLNDFGFENEWITENKLHKTDDDSLFKNYKIFLPKDLTIPELLVDLFDNFQSNQAKLECRELNTKGETSFNIYSGDHLKIKSTLLYGKGERKKCTVGILLDHFELSSTEDSLLIGTAEPFCLIISPSSESADKIDFISKNNKEYAVILDDNISELKFKLSSGYSEKRISGSLKSIVGNFSNAICYLIDGSSDVFNSQIGEYILKELDRRKIKYFNIRNFENLEDQPGGDVSQKLENILQIKNGNENLSLVEDQNNFKGLISEISKKRKMGYKFLRPSKVLELKNEKNSLSY